MIKIYNWSDICDRFTDGLLLGNGASISINRSFSYESLFQAAKDMGHLDDDVSLIFEAFDSHDFELVLRRLWQAEKVNLALGVHVGKVQWAYMQVRNALISTVRDVHVPHRLAKSSFEPIYKFLQRFKVVFSLNYDLLMYWSTTYSRQYIGNWFKDCFNAGSFRTDWKSFFKPYKAEGATLCFYPHGNLVLARTLEGSETKISAEDGEDLLERILTQWRLGAVSPLFVSEGTSGQKISAIESSPYLLRVLSDIIPSVGDSLVVYGWGVGDQDQHILDKICRARPARIAVSVFRNDQDFAARVERRLLQAGVNEVLFFDAESPGCWCH